MKAACFPAKQDLNKVLVVLCTILWRYCGDLSCTVDVDPSHPQAFIEEKTLLCNPDKSRQDSSSARQDKTRQDKTVFFVVVRSSRQGKERHGFTITVVCSIFAHV